MLDEGRAKEKGHQLIFFSSPNLKKSFNENIKGNREKNVVDHQRIHIHDNFFFQLHFIFFCFFCVHHNSLEKLIKFLKERKNLGRFSNRKIYEICGDKHKHLKQENLSKFHCLPQNREVDELCHTNPNFSQIDHLMNFIHHFLKKSFWEGKKKESF